MASAPTENPLVYVGPVKRGRPQTYSDEIAQEICDRIACGETLTNICLEEDMPDRVTVWRWLTNRLSFAQRYAHAREAQADFEADEIRDISDESGGDAYIEHGPSGPVAKIDGEAIQRSKLRIETRRWRAERLNRRVYGNSVKHEFEPTVHPANGEKQLPPGLGWLAGQLPEPQPAAGPEPDDSGVGEE